MKHTSSSGSIGNPGSTDSGLLAGVLAQDKASWNRFADEYSPLVYIWCRQCDLQPADALDVSQQVFQAVNRSIGTFSKSTGEGSFRGWMWTITRNLVRNHFARELRGPRARGGSSIQLRLLDEPELIEEESLSSVQLSGNSSTLLSTIETVREDFDERTWECFWRMVVREQSAAEIAETFQMKPSAVRQAKYRVTRRLRRDLGDFA